MPVPLSEPRVLIPQEQIATMIDRLAMEIRRHYRTRPPLLVGVLKGAFIFLADLVRALSLPVEIDFVRLCSYGSGTASSGQIEVLMDVRTPITGKDVLIVEDIVDSGYTIAFLQKHLALRHPASMRVCTLLDKPSRRVVPVPIDYCGFSIPDVFVVGYGIDWNEQYRDLHDICYLEEKDNAAASVDPGRQG
jgi:hypoxanthine phosphoribosyltransferase